MRSCLGILGVHPVNLVFPEACRFQGPRSMLRAYRSSTTRLCFFSLGVDSVSSLFNIRPRPLPLLPQPAGGVSSIVMSTAASDKKESSISRREKIAQAAEQRLTKKATADSTKSSSGDNLSRKRQASPREGGTSQQIGFSDSDGSDSEVACLGVSSVGHGLTGKKDEGKSEVAEAKDADGGAKKRARKRQVTLRIHQSAADHTSVLQS